MKYFLFSSSVLRLFRLPQKLFATGNLRIKTNPTQKHMNFAAKTHVCRKTYEIFKNIYNYYSWSIYLDRTWNSALNAPLFVKIVNFKPKIRDKQFENMKFLSLKLIYSETKFTFLTRCSYNIEETFANGNIYTRLNKHRYLRFYEY